MAWGDFRFRETIHRCFRCGYCKFPATWADVNNCPPYARFRMESYSCGGRLWLARAWLEEKIDWTDHLARILYSCTTCRNCAVKCPLSFNVDIVDMITGVRSEMVERGRVPVEVKRLLENLELFGNPYGLSRSKREGWAREAGLEEFDGHDYLFFVGCAGSYDTRARAAAAALGRVLRAAGLSFGVLGSDENCDGNEVRMLGESGLFQMLAEKNIDLFAERKVSRIVTFSPHGYNALKNLYSEYDVTFSVFHYTQILRDLIHRGRLGFRGGGGIRATFHDPCFLGRWNNEYEAPRAVLAAVPGLQLVEMEKNRDGALCCGGGGGNFVMDLLGGSADSPARRRVREAVETKAEILAVACPKCLVMLTDAVKAEDCEDIIAVKDISEVLEEASPLPLR